MTVVYRDFDQEALDLQYNNQAQVPDPKRYLDWYDTASAAARARVAHQPDIAYGPLPDERLDIFQPGEAAASDRRPVVIFVHGGAWRHLDRTRSSFAAETFTARGALFVAVGFSRMPAAGSLDEMVMQVRSAFAWLWSNIEAHGGDRDRMHLIGHSSGAHLGAMVMTTEWPRLFGIPAAVVRSAVLVSGIYDLEPVRLSYRNEILKLDRAAELRNSPCRNLLVGTAAPLLIGYGEFDTAEFKRQAHAFEAVWQRCHGNSRLVELKGLNHYECAETLVEADSVLSRLAMEWFSI